MNRAAMFYKKQDSKATCGLCPHRCVISEGKHGICSVRVNEKGELLTTNYGEITSAAVDPIEKKPLYHFKPGKYIFSVGSFGCNMTCSFCQNYSISQHKPKSQFVPPEALLEVCEEQKDSIGIAFTYNEPSIWYEYIYDCATLFKKNKPEFNIVLVTNGFIELEPLKEILPYLDAMNIDLKGWSDAYYRKVCGARVEPVKEVIRSASSNCHVEITTLLVTGENDTIEEVSGIAQFIGGINRNIPLHLSRYFPQYKMEQPPTEISDMKKAKEACDKFLNFVYVGNVQGIDNSTYCYHCGEKLIDRSGYSTKIITDSSNCAVCGYDNNIIL